MAKPGKMGYIKPKEIQKRIHGEYEDKIQMGYDKVKVRRKEGEKWTDDKGKQWEVKNGIVQSIPRFTDIRVPLFCPKCNGVMGKKSKDTEVYYKFGFCLDCLIERDAEMIRQGTYKQYEENYIKSKQLGFYQEAKIEIEEYLKTLEKGYLEYVNEEGKLERWEGDDVGKMKTFWEDELKEIDKKLEELK